MAEHKKIGIMGGTFNPIHFGHLLLAETAFHQFNLDEILIMPTKNPYYKKISNSVTEEDRVAMVELAIEDNVHFQLSKEELNREGTTYTVETLSHLTVKHPGYEYRILERSRKDFRNGNHRRCRKSWYGNFFKQPD